MGFCGFTVLRFYGCWVMGFCGYEVLRFIGFYGSVVWRSYGSVV